MTHIFLGNTRNADKNGTRDQRTTVETQHQSRLVTMKISYTLLFWRHPLTLIYQTFRFTWKTWPPSSSFFDRIRRGGGGGGGFKYGIYDCTLKIQKSRTKSPWFYLRFEENTYRSLRLKQWLLGYKIRRFCPQGTHLENNLSKIHVTVLKKFAVLL